MLRKLLSKLLTALIIMAVFLGIDIYVAHKMEPDARTPWEAVKRAQTEILAYTLAYTMKWKLHVPLQVDSMTRLVDIHAERNMVVYSMATTIDGDQFDTTMQGIHDHVNETSCARDDYRKMLSYGLAIAVGYRSPSGKESVPVMITPAMCGM